MEVRAAEEETEIPLRQELPEGLCGGSDISMQLLTGPAVNKF